MFNKKQEQLICIGTEIIKVKCFLISKYVSKAS